MSKKSSHVKIIQLIKSDYIDEDKLIHYTLHGLGDDSNVYLWDWHTSTWSLYGRN